MSHFAGTLIDHAIANGGIVTRSEGLALGVPSTSLSRMVRQGILVQCGPGAYALPGRHDDQVTPLYAACRKLSAVVSHESAAQIHGLERPRDITPTVSVLRGSTNSFAGVTIHQPTDLTEDQVTRLRELPVTTPERTIVDLAAVITKGHLERIIDNGLAARIFELDELTQLFSSLGRRGKPGTKKLRQILEARGVGYVAPESEMERRLIGIIERSGLPTPDRQYKPEWLTTLNGRVDLCYPDHKVVIEADSRRWHTLSNAFETDRLRDNAANLAGWTVLRFTWEEIVKRPERVVSSIATALNLRQNGPDTVVIT